MLPEDGEMDWIAYWGPSAMFSRVLCFLSSWKAGKNKPTSVCSSIYSLWHQEELCWILWHLYKVSCERKQASCLGNNHILKTFSEASHKENFSQNKEANSPKHSGPAEALSPFAWMNPGQEFTAGSVYQKHEALFGFSWWHCLGTKYTTPLLSLAKVTSDAYNLTAILSEMRNNSVTLVLNQPYKAEIH